jgi:hypothetical protein
LLQRELDLEDEELAPLMAALTKLGVKKAEVNLGTCGWAIGMLSQ